MNIGITYDLRDQYLAEGYGEEETAEFDRVDTIDAICTALKGLGHRTDRIGNARELVQRLAAGDRWELVFNICEGLRGAGREAQVPAILDLYEIPYTFADPCVMAVCLDKSVTKSVVRNAGLPTPRSLLIRDFEEADRLAAYYLTTSVTNYRSGPRIGLRPKQPLLAPAPHSQKQLQATGDATLPCLRFPLFAKPVAEGTSKGVTPASRVQHAEDLYDVCESLLVRYRQPVLIEEYLPGREFTVGILGTGNHASCLGTLEIRLLDQAESDVYSFANKEHCEELVEYRLVRPAHDPVVRRAESIALAAWRALSCRDGGRIDLRCDSAGDPQFIEANPLAGLHPTHSDLPMLATALGLPYHELVGRIVDSAVECGAAAAPRRLRHRTVNRRRVTSVIATGVSSPASSTPAFQEP